MSRLKDKTALITGGNSGLGLATAQQFLAEGAKRVFITGRRQAELDAAVKQLGERATGIQGDISSLADLDKLYAAVKAKTDRLDILFANAGGGEFVPLADVTEAHFDKWFGINVKGTLFTIQKALPLMPNGGSIVINGSIAALQAMPAFGVYSATKAALRSLARTWALELKERKIRVNVISPGMVITPAYKTELKMTDQQISEFETQFTANIPSGRAGTPDEIAKAVAFLASSDSSYVNGGDLVVDGGAIQI